MKNTKPIKIYFLFILAVMLQINNVNAQNLVPNPSFEEYSDCPDNGSQLERVVDWFVYYISPDFYNGCANSSSGFSIPENWTGEQCANTGSGYIGIYTYISNPDTLFREIVFSELKDSLTIGNKYFITLSASLSDLSICSSNNIGILFTTNNDTSHSILNNFAHMHSISIVTNTSNWVKINASFIADSSYKYIYVGNFFDNSSTDTIIQTGIYCYSYYYIDDVCVSEDSLTCVDIKPQIINFSSDNAILNQGECTEFNISTQVDYDFFQWIFEGAELGSSELLNPIDICYSDSGQFDVTLIAYNSNGCADTIKKENFITVNNSNNLNDDYTKLFTISPNPFTDRIIVKKTNQNIELNTLELTDALGKTYFIQINYFDDKIVLTPVQSLDEGVYFLRIIINNKAYTTKLLHFIN